MFVAGPDAAPGHRRPEPEWRTGLLADQTVSRIVIPHCRAAGISDRAVGGLAVSFGRHVSEPPQQFGAVHRVDHRRRPVLSGVFTATAQPALHAMPLWNVVDKT